MDACGEIVTRLNLDPGLVVKAMFEQSRRNKQPDGPYLSLFKSESAILKAVSSSLNIPIDAVKKMGNPEDMVSRVEEKWLSAKTRLDQAAYPENVYSVPASFRWMWYANLVGAEQVMAELADDVLREMSESPAVTLWLESYGFDRDAVHSYKEP